MIRRNAPMRAAEKRQLWAQTGKFETRLGQHENAITSYRLALDKDDPNSYRSLIAAMHSAKKAPGEIETAVRNYMAEFPKRGDRYELLAQVAHAYAGDKNTAKALQVGGEVMAVEDRKSTRLNSSHVVISYAVFCLKKKKKNDTTRD